LLEVKDGAKTLTVMTKANLYTHKIKEKAKTFKMCPLGQDLGLKDNETSYMVKISYRTSIIMSL